MINPGRKCTASSKRSMSGPGVTTLHITHSLNEAHRLADRLYILEYGKLIEQADGETEQSLSDAPVS